MKETENSPPSAPRTRRWVRATLIASLALNLMILGVIGGAVLGNWGGPSRATPGEAAYGPYARALSDEDRAALRLEMRAAAPRLRENRTVVRQGFRDLLDALRAEPYAPSRVAAILEAQETRVRDHGQIWRGLMLQRLDTMTPEDRAAFADRLEKVLRRGPSRDRRERSALR